MQFRSPLDGGHSGDRGAYRSDQAFYCALALATLIVTIINFMLVKPGQGAVMERRHQRYHGRADHDDAASQPPPGHGPVHAAASAQGRRLVGHGRDGLTILGLIATVLV
jgi:hypothetical protein